MILTIENNLLEFLRLYLNASDETRDLVDYLLAYKPRAIKAEEPVVEPENRSSEGGARIYENVKRLCEKKRMSIRALEQCASLGNGTIGKWSESTPTIETLYMVAEVLGTTIDNLVYGD